MALVIVAAASCLSFALPPSVVVTRLTDLGFGEVATDASKHILYSDPGAASFRIDATGIVAQEIIGITLTLPGQLSSGGDVIPMTYSTADAAWSYLDGAAGATTFDPNTGTQVAKQGANFSIYVWIGASVNTTSATVSNTYSNSLTLDAAVQ